MFFRRTFKKLFNNSMSSLKISLCLILFSIGFVSGAVCRNSDTLSDRSSSAYFKAVGNEPFWSVEVSSQSIKFTSLTEVKEVFTNAPRTVLIMDVAGKSFIGNSDSADVNVSIFQEECTDNMSGEKFPFSVTVDIAFKNGERSRIFKGCGKYLNDTAVNGKTWMLTALKGHNIENNGEQKIPSMTFNFDENRVSGNAGCNSYNGYAQGIGNQIKFGHDFVMTRMMCPDMETERNFIETIKGKTYDYEMRDDKLFFKNGDNVIMEFLKSNN